MFLLLHQFVCFFFVKKKTKRCQRSNPERAYGLISIIVRTSEVKEEVKNGFFTTLVI